MPRDPYVYPGTNVLVNHFNERNPSKLADLEKRAAAGRIIELCETHLDGDFDYAHLQTIHRYLFQDVYPWAGEPRVIGIQKNEPTLNGKTVQYPHPRSKPPEDLGTRANYVFTQLAKDNYLQGLHQKEFADRFIKYYMEIWEVHPFRDGNTRTTTVLMLQVAIEAGYFLSDPPAIPRYLRNALVEATQGNKAILNSRTTLLINQ